MIEVVISWTLITTEKHETVTRGLVVIAAAVFLYKLHNPVD